MLKRRRFKQSTSLEERLAAEARSLREEAGKLRPCFKRDQLLRKARQNETASHVSGWLQSPGLKPPT